MNSLEPGTLVVCNYRHPSPIQPWIHEIYVGVVEKLGDNPAEWNNDNSERYHCELHGLTRVRYEWGIQHDKTADLVPITKEQAALSFRDKVSEFLGEEARACLDKYC